MRLIDPDAVYTMGQASRLLSVKDETLRTCSLFSKLRPAKVGKAYRLLGIQLINALGGNPIADSKRAKRSEK